ncbi:hypothetical protein [Arsenicicoccus dermatophilus]|uniref:hypothetical protein n=1 Tax=Arsenicicoccus dermatophilus TaxID=1076331 RepID=UPI001F4CF885|nr:hypothetical protein [Arsenicicoccus dermatophilus]MCH8612790.1 hypothetical protein [Arsenicicoccus dermatophilus]
MTAYGVSTDAVDASGRTARTLADEFVAARVATVLDEVAGALPGSLAGVAASDLGALIDARTTAVAGRVGSLASGLCVAAGGYATCEAAATGALGGGR